MILTVRSVHVPTKKYIQIYKQDSELKYDHWHKKWTNQHKVSVTPDFSSATIPWTAVRQTVNLLSVNTQTTEIPDLSSKDPDPVKLPKC